MKPAANSAAGPNSGNVKAVGKTGAKQKDNSLNPMRKIKIAKITLNVGAGKNEDMLKKSPRLLEKLSPVKAVNTLTKKRIPGWGLRPGLAIGCKTTVRTGTEKLLKRLMAAKENTLSKKNFDTQGNFSFGIPEYIDIAGMEYDPELKILGLDAAVTLERPGYRLAKKRIRAHTLGKKHRITKEEAIQFVQSLGVEVV